MAAPERCPLPSSEAPHAATGELAPTGPKKWYPSRPIPTLAVYTGHANLDQFLDAFRAAGLSYRWLITGVNANGGGTRKGPGSGPGIGTIMFGGAFFSMSRVILLLQKGGKLLTASMIHDVLLTTERQKKYFDWEQPLSESIELCICLSKPGDLIADLTMGSGTVAEAVARVGGGRRFFGCEVEEGLCRIGESRVAEALGAKKKPALV